MDTPDISQTIGEAFDSQSEPLQIESTETPPETAPPEVQKVEQQPEESFTTIDPTKLPPEMLAEYKRWQGDYTKKRQTEKAELKTLQEKLATYEQGNNHSNQITNDFNQAKQDGQIDPNMSISDYTKLIKEDIKSEIKTDSENTYIETQEQAFYTLDPRLAESPGQDKMLLNYVAGELGSMRDQYEAEHQTILGFDFTGNAKKLIEQFDKRTVESNKAFVAKQSEMAKSNSAKSAQAFPKANSSSGKPSGKASFEDAASAAWDNAN